MTTVVKGSGSIASTNGGHVAVFTVSDGVISDFKPQYCCSTHKNVLKSSLHIYIQNYLKSDEKH